MDLLSNLALGLSVAVSFQNLLYALLGKLADLLAKGLERWWLRWHPGYQVAAKT